MSPSLYYVSLGMLVILMRLRKANHGYFPVFTYFWVMRARLTTTALYYLRLFIDHYMTYLTTGMAKRQNVNFKEGVALQAGTMLNSDQGQRAVVQASAEGRAGSAL